MFFGIEPKTATNNQPKRDISAGEALGIGAFVLGIMGYMARHKIERWFVANFDEIGLTACAIIAVAALGAIWLVKRYTEALSKRANLLLPLANKERGIFIGKTHDGVPLHLPEEARTGHSQIIAATGKGKTESVVMAWLQRDIAQRRSAILIDGKGDPEIVEPVKRMLDPESNLYVFDLGNPKTSSAVNPLENGTAQQITDRIFTAFEFEDPYYRAVQFDIAGSIIRLIQEVDFYEYASPTERKRFAGIVTFKRLYGLLSSDECLAEAVGQSKDVALSQKLTEFLRRPKEKRQKDLSGLLSQLAPFAEGEVSELVNGGSDEIPRSCCNVSELLNGLRRRQTVFLILIPTLKYQQIGHQLGKLLLQELGWAVGERASRGEYCNFLPVYLDEFSAFVYPGFSNILNKARSSNVALHLSHQSLGDLGIVSEDFAKIVNTNTNIKCILGLNDPETADYFARHLGTETSEKLTEQAEKKELFSGRKKTGDMSIREVEAYKVHPNRLKNYANGRGVIHFPTVLGNVTEEIQFERFKAFELL